MSRCALQRAIGTISDSGWWRLMEDRAAHHRVSLAAVIVIGAMLSVPRDEAVFGLTLPESDPFRTIDLLQRLADGTKNIIDLRSFCYRRMAEIERTLEAR